jgi:8-oxo-dGTP pyrophosphatase MutT (NUDIX family)
VPFDPAERVTGIHTRDPLKTEIAGDFEVFEVMRHEVTTPRGLVRRCFTLEMRDWVTVVAVTEARRFVLVRQHRHGVDAETLETAGGIVDPGEDPAAAALRELHEETGYVAETAEPLGWVHPNPALQANRCHMFLARGARDTGALACDEHEITAPVILDEAELSAAMIDGQITHALVLVALHRALGSLGRRG